MKLSLKLWALTLGTAAAITFALCVLWGSFAPPEIHSTSLLEAIFPGFRWLSFESFVLGLVESFLYGVYAALVIVPLHNFFVRLGMPAAR